MKADTGKRIPERHEVYTLIGKIDGTRIAKVTVPGKGCVDVDLGKHIASIKCFYVVGCFRRRGVGSAIFAEVLLLCERFKIVSLCFTVRKTNAVAIKFYKKHGAVCCYDSGPDWVFAVPLDGKGGGK